MKRRNEGGRGDEMSNLCWYTLRIHSYSLYHLVPPSGRLDGGWFIC
jgi:hypothetical protein